MKEFLQYIIIKKDDITKEDSDAIVNAANPRLLGGGGVDGAIHNAAGPGLLEECKKFGGCNHGEARITSGYNLQARHVIHTPGPVFKDGKSGERTVLENSYKNSLMLARENGLKSISFPAISTGIYGYPLKEACEVAVTSALKFMKDENYPIEVRFVLFNESNYNLYNELLEGLKKSELS